MIALLLSAAMCFTAVTSSAVTAAQANLPTAAAAQESKTANSGSFGQGLTWSIDNGKLTISGSGKMPTYTSASYTPWYDYRTSVTDIEICEGVTNIGRSAFYNFTALKSVSIASTVQIIESLAFSGSGITSVVIPASVDTVAAYAFKNCASLSSVVFENPNCTIIGNSDTICNSSTL